MLKIKTVTGINNVLPQERLQQAKEGLPLREASNVDINDDGELMRREGFTLSKTGCYHNLYEAPFGLLATNNDGALVSLIDGNETVLYAALGQDRVWYADLPDGRVAFSNASINGIVNADGLAMTTWGVPIPAGVGTFTEVGGGLVPGDYRVRVTHVRLSDGLESGPVYGIKHTLGAGFGASFSNKTGNATSGIMLTSLPTLAGHKTNVYITAVNGEETAYYAGSTTNSMFTFAGSNADLVLPCRTDWLKPAPVGILSTVWQSRALTAVGNVLYASKPGQVEHFDTRRDWKQFPSDITVIAPIDEGIWLGTETELCFLQGREFDKLKYNGVVVGRAVKGSGVTIVGELVKHGDGVGSGHSIMCIADGVIVAGHSDGSVDRLTQDSYRTTATEVIATVRLRDGISQYVALKVS